MTNNKEFFDELYTGVNEEVYTASGKALKVEGTGTGTIKCLLNSGKERIVKIKNVVYIPDLYGNLLSVKRIEDNGFEIYFKNNQCTITDGEEIIAVADCI